MESNICRCLLLVFMEMLLSFMTGSRCQCWNMESLDFAMHRLMWKQSSFVCVWEWNWVDVGFSNLFNSINVCCRFVLFLIYDLHSTNFHSSKHYSGRFWNISYFEHSHLSFILMIAIIHITIYWAWASQPCQMAGQACLLAMNLKTSSPQPGSVACLIILVQLALCRRE